MAIVLLCGAGWLSLHATAVEQDDKAAQTAPMRRTTAAPVQIRLGDQITPSLVARLSPLRAASVNTATFVVNYNGFSPAAQNAFQAAVNIWQTIVRSNVPIVVDATWTPLEGNILGQGGPGELAADFFNAPRADTWFPNALANAYAGFHIDPVDDITTVFNSSFGAWYFGTDGRPAANQIDFESVVLHELGHGLGMVGSVLDSGTFAGFSGWPFIYDVYTQDSAGFPLLSFTDGFALHQQLTSNSVYFGGPATRSSNGGFAARLYAPAAWQDGSSYSHLDEATYKVGNPNSLMTPIINYAEAIHDPGAIVRGMFADMGWNIGGIACSYTLSTHSATVPAFPVTLFVSVSTSPGCSWTAVSNAGFISVSNKSTQAGSGSVLVSTTSNIVTDVPTTTRTGTVLIAGQAFTITQTGCTYAVSPTDEAFGAAGGPGALSVTAPTSCSWDVQNVPAWVSGVSSVSSAGSRAVRYTVDAGALGVSRSGSMRVAGIDVTLTQLGIPLSRLAAGATKVFTLGDDTDTRVFAADVEANRSYCGRLLTGPTEPNESTATITALASDQSTLGGGSPGTSQVCVIAPMSGSILFQAVQDEATARTHVIQVAETTLFTNWSFTAGTYSSFTLLRNTSARTVHAMILWRDPDGRLRTSQSATLPPNALVAFDARTSAPGATSGSIEVAHDGDPDAIVGSQTTLSDSSGLAFDPLPFRRRRR